MVLRFRPMSDWHSAGKLEEMKDRRSKLVEVAGKEIALYSIQGKFHATANFCPHRGGPLFQGNIEPGPAVRCPLHGWLFDMESGECLNIPNAKVSVFPVEIRGEEIFIQI